MSGLGNLGSAELGLCGFPVGWGAAVSFQGVLALAGFSPPSLTPPRTVRNPDSFWSSGNLEQKGGSDDVIQLGLALVAMSKCKYL